MTKNKPKNKDFVNGSKLSDAEKIRQQNQKAGSTETRVGQIIQGRTVDPSDYDRWEQQRLERKSKRHTVDPYRYY